VEEGNRPQSVLCVARLDSVEEGNRPQSVLCVARLDSEEEGNRATVESLGQVFNGYILREAPRVTNDSHAGRAHC
jgi:hypothetical protein